MIGIKLIMTIIGIVGIESLVLVFFCRQNRKLRRAFELSKRETRLAHERVERGVKLMEKRIKNQEGVADEKKEVAEAEDSTLVHYANKLFPKRLSDEKNRR